MSAQVRINPYHISGMYGNHFTPEKTHTQIDSLDILSYASFHNLACLRGHQGSQRICCQGFHLLGELLDMCQDTGKWRDKYLGSKPRSASKARSAPPADFLRSGIPFMCSPAAPCRLSSCDALELRLRSLPRLTQVCRTCLCSGVNCTVFSAPGLPLTSWILPFAIYPSHDHRCTAAKKTPTSFGTAPFLAILGKYTVFVPRSSRCHPPYQLCTNHPECVRALCIFLQFSTVPGSYRVVKSQELLFQHQCGLTYILYYFPPSVKGPCTQFPQNIAQWH